LNGFNNVVISRKRSSARHFALCLGLLLSALAASASPASAQNLIVNGDFGINGGDHSVNTVPPWTGIDDGVYVCLASANCNNNFSIGAPAGTGAYAYITPNLGGGAAQNVTLARSGSYQFSFYHVANGLLGNNPTLNVTVGGQTVFNGLDTATSWTLLTAKLTLAAGLNAIDFTGTWHGGFDELIGDVSLVFLPGSISPALPQGAPVNAVNVAGGIDKFLGNGGTLPVGLQGVSSLSGQSLVNALLQLDGQTSTEAERGAFQLMNQFMGLMLDPFVDGRFGGGASSFAPDREASLPPDIAMAYASMMKAPPMPPQNDRWSVWGTGFGGVNHSGGNADAGSADVSASTYGFASGADYHFNRDTLVGFALAGAGTNWRLSQSLGSGRSDAFQAGVYGKTAWGPVYLAAAVAYTQNWFTTNRVALGDQLTAKFNGESFGGRLESGYRYVLPSTAGRFEVTPYGAIQAQSFRTPNYSETDFATAGLGLNFNSMSATDTRGELGARFANTMALSGMPLILRARLAWAHDWVDNPALSAAFQTLPGSSFTVNGAPIPSDSALASVGAELHMSTHWSALAKFDGEFASNSQTYAGTGTLRYTW
jgi:uncharacterized protein YhjY with autotransporter beta-barrel domain